MPRIESSTETRSESRAGRHIRAGRRLRATFASLLGCSVLALGVSTSPAAAAKGFTVKVKSGSTMALAFTTQAFSRINNTTLGSTVGTTTTPLAPATMGTPGTLMFPLSKGSLNSVSGHGNVNGQGGLTIASHLSLAGLFSSESSVTGNSPAISLGSKSTISIENFTPHTVPILNLNLAHVKVHGSRSFHAGEQIGTVTIQVKG